MTVRASRRRVSLSRSPSTDSPPRTAEPTRQSVSILSSSPSASSDVHPAIFRRFSTLFNSSSDDPLAQSPPFSESLNKSRLEVVQEPAPVQPQPDRAALKILVVTWNMGDALPKGDLSVLLGNVPPYEPPKEKSDTIPQFAGGGHGHPYHVIVVASQECPTLSGVPRGLGGGIIKGSGLQKELAKQREKDLAKEKKSKAPYSYPYINDKDKGRDSPSNLTKDTAPLNGLGLNDVVTTHTESKSSQPVPVSTLSATLPTDTTPIHVTEPKAARPETVTRAAPSRPSIDTSHPPVKGPHAPGATMSHEGMSPSSATLSPGGIGSNQGYNRSNPSKGWSAMLEEWLCAGPPVLKSVPINENQTGNGYFPDFKATSSPLEPADSTSSGPRTIATPPSVETFQPRSFKSSTFSATSLSNSRRPRGHSTSDSGAGLLYSTSEDRRRGLARSVSLSKRLPSERLKESPHVEIVQREPGAGPYVNVCKERLLGLYMSVFVYKDCEHLVRGVDKDYVTTGLAGGRFGNKGGIGISLDLDGHRLLFVNAHLAAHTDKNAERLANIAKIKSELTLNCFLPPNDPRTGCADITDRFDSAFWFGDLNFRVDITLLHARWLLDQKKYTDALMFDQLRKAMNDAKTNPLPGFEEAKIDFMPTFKYDVWKSVRATNRELRRSLRKSRRGTNEHPERPLSMNGTSFEALDDSAVLEEDEYEDAVGDLPCGTNPANVLDTPEIPDMDLPTTAFPDFSLSIPVSSDSDSIHSSGGAADERPDQFSASGPNATYNATRSIASTRSNISNITSPVSIPRAHNRTQSISKSFKDRGRQILGMFKNSSSRSYGLDSVGPDTQSWSTDRRRPSTSSFQSVSDGGQSVLSRSSAGAAAVLGRTATSSNGSAIPPSGSHKLWSSPPTFPVGRQQLTRSISSRSVKLDDSHHPLRVDENGDFDESVDYRVGVYDTSKKQRIPSWCDRVLYKSQVISESQEATQIPFSSRVGRAISNLMRRKSATFDNPHMAQQTRVEQSLQSTPTNALLKRPQDNWAQPLVNNSPSPAPKAQRKRSISFAEPDVNIANGAASLSSFDSSDNESLSNGPHSPVVPKFIVNNPEWSGDDTQGPLSVAQPVVSRTDKEQLTWAPGLAAGAPAPKVTTPTRQRSLTAGSFDSGLPGIKRRVSVASSRRSSTSLRSRGSLGSISFRRWSTNPSTDQGSVFTPDLARSVSTGPNPNSNPSTTNLDFRSWSASLDQPQASALRRFFGRFQSRASLHINDEPKEMGAEESVPRRHKKGEVEVLHYGTIDDAGMRQLEGRSDHRPAIFSAAIYVGD